MALVLRLLLSRWSLSFVGTVLLALVAWFFAPLLEIFSDGSARLIAVAALLLAWAGVNLLIGLRRRRREATLLDGVAGARGDAAASAVGQEAAALRDRLTSALRLLRRGRGRRGYLYAQPWYAIIGPPGAGKTTLLQNAGLSFPLAAEMGRDALRGVGGTRLCEWWFTDDAVLIDTAGRYTTQDSDAALDRGGWETFLDLLKRTRARQPLNGVIVAIAVNEIALGTAEARAAHARAVRSRLKELDTRFGMRLPVYVLFTKADLIAGFTEFFDDLDREQRGQIWGITFPLAAGPLAAGTAGEDASVAAFGAEFHALAARIEGQLVDRLQAEPSVDRRTFIAGFPAQFASLKQPLAAFLEQTFGGSPSDRRPLLRGVYFTSGTQDGTPFDRLSGSLARLFGLDQRRLPSLRPEKGRSYFLARLLRDVIFGEAMLVAEPPASGRRFRLARAAGFAAVALVVMLAAAAFWRERDAGQRQIDAAQASLAAYERTAKGLPLDPVNDSDFPLLVPLLDQAAALPYDADGAVTAGGTALGLSQDDKLRAAGRTVYRHALENAMLPRMIWRLEAQMRGRLDDPEFLYEATRVYLMLGGAGPLDPALVRAWARLDWEASYPGAAAAPIRSSLLRHLDALLAEPLPAVQLDGTLVDQARATFSRVSVAQRVYSRIRPSAAARSLPPWRPVDALGPAGSGLFVRASGRKLDEGIPGFLTVDGFHKVLLPSLPDAASSVATESWVLGKNADVAQGEAQVAALEHDVIGLYEVDYAQAWDAMLNDLNVVPLRNVTQAAQDLFVLASPQSPLRDLLAAIARQLTLSVPTDADKAAADSDPARGGAPAAPATAGAIAVETTASVSERLSKLLGGSAANQSSRTRPGAEIDDRYKTLRDVAGNGAGAPIDLVLKPVDALRQQMAKLAQAPVGAAPPPLTGDDPAVALRAEARRQPDPLARWLVSLANDATTLRGGNSRQQIAAAFNGAGGPASFCALATEGRYPFVPGSANDIPLDDFARLFAPGGLLDGFFNTQLRPYVDTSGKAWQPQAVDGVAAPVTAADVASFQRAETIRDIFFPGGGSAPVVGFDIAPVSLDPGALQASLDLGGTVIVSSHAPPASTQITWPGPHHMQSARLAFDPPPGDGPGVMQESGPWAMFRLFGRARLQQGRSPELHTLTFTLGNRSAAFEIRAASLLNPFVSGVLQDFRCPSVR